MSTPHHAAASLTVKRSDLVTVRMVAGGEARHPVVIDDRTVKEWVGIGWIDLRRATADDYTKYPTVKD